MAAVNDFWINRDPSWKVKHENMYNGARQAALVASVMVVALAVIASSLALAINRGAFAGTDLSTLVTTNLHPDQIFIAFGTSLGLVGLTIIAARALGKSLHPELKFNAYARQAIEDAHPFIRNRLESRQHYCTEFEGRFFVFRRDANNAFRFEGYKTAEQVQKAVYKLEQRGYTDARTAFEDPTIPYTPAYLANTEVNNAFEIPTDANHFWRYERTNTEGVIVHFVQTANDLIGYKTAEEADAATHGLTNQLTTTDELPEAYILAQHPAVYGAHQNNGARLARHDVYDNGVALHIVEREGQSPIYCTRRAHAEAHIVAINEALDPNILATGTHWVFQLDGARTYIYYEDHTLRSSDRPPAGSVALNNLDRPGELTQAGVAARIPAATIDSLNDRAAALPAGQEVYGQLVNGIYYSMTQDGVTFLKALSDNRTRVLRLLPQHTLQYGTALQQIECSTIYACGRADANVYVRYNATLDDYELSDQPFAETPLLATAETEAGQYSIDGVRELYGAEVAELEAMRVAEGTQVVGTIGVHFHYVVKHDGVTFTTALRRPHHPLTAQQYKVFASALTQPGEWMIFDRVVCQNVTGRMTYLPVVPGDAENQVTEISAETALLVNGGTPLPTWDGDRGYGAMRANEHWHVTKSLNDNGQVWALLTKNADGDPVTRYFLSQQARANVMERLGRKWRTNYRIWREENTDPLANEFIGRTDVEANGMMLVVPNPDDENQSLLYTVDDATADFCLYVLSDSIDDYLDGRERIDYVAPASDDAA